MSSYTSHKYVNISWHTKPGFVWILSAIEALERFFLKKSLIVFIDINAYWDNVLYRTIESSK